ncbi:hypothetical protein Tco_0916798 [Tanacetum coccineum]
MNFQDSPEDSQSVPSNTDLDNLFSPLYEEYYATSSPEVLDNSAANTLDNENTSSSSIIIEEDEAPEIVSTSAEQVATEPNSSVLNENADELDPSNMHEFHQKYRSSDKRTMTRNRLQTNAEVCMFGLCKHKADWILYVTLVPQLDDIEMCFTAQNPLEQAMRDIEFALLNWKIQSSACILVPGGFKDHDVKGMILAAKYVEAQQQRAQGNKEILVPRSETKLILSERQSTGTVTMHYCEFDDYDHSTKEERFLTFPNTVSLIDFHNN